VHEENVDVADVVDKESLVAGWCKVLGLPVATVTDLIPCVLADIPERSYFPSGSSA
jgi:hypothetical protein